MGTSSSGKGRNSQSPLVPAHADADPGQPLPEPEGQRFRGFRTEFGRAVAGAGSFASALGKYARDATGGVAFGPRRFGTAYTASGSLVELISELQQGGTGENSIGIDLDYLTGRPVGEAIEAIAQALAPDNADQDLIRIAVQEALAEVFPDIASFEPSALTPDDLIAVLVDFFSRILFQDITSDAGDAWNKAPDDARTVEAENELMDVIHASVDNHLSPVLASGIQNLTRPQLEALERRAIDDIWAEWESYE